MNIDRAITIPGWMQEPELLWLAERASERKVIVEVGSYLGRSTRALADNAAGTVYAIDDWFGPRDVIIAHSDREKIFGMFCANMDGLQGRLNVIRCDHEKIEFDLSPDMVFIDGDHTPEAVSHDIKFWLKKIAPGGLLCGHDYGISKETVDRFFPEVKVAPDTDIWFVELSANPFQKSSAKGRM